MAATGILRASDVIFYHPLNDLTELTQSQAWTGVAGFVPGKIGQAESALVGDTPVLGTPITLTGGGQAQNAVVIRLDDTRALILTPTGSDAQARVATVSGTDVTVGAISVIGATGGVANSPRGAHFGGGIVAVHWRQSATMKVAVLTVVGDTVTVGAEESITGGIPGDMASLTSTSGLMTYTETSGGVSPGDVVVRVINISGTTVTLGARHQLTLISGGLFGVGNAITKLTTTTAAVVWGEGDGSNTFTAVITVTGLTLTVGASQSVVVLDSKTNDSLSIVTLTPTKVAYTYHSSPQSRFKVADIAGTTFTFGAELVTETFVGFVHMNALSSTKVIIASRGSGFVRIKLVTVSGLDTSLGPLVVGGAAAAGSTGSAALNSTTFLHMNSSLVAGALSSSSSISAPTPGAYPSAIGHDRVVVAMWAKSLTPSGSTVTVERGYSVGLTPTTITLGGTTATWSGAAIATPLMSTMNDGSDHLLVLDFENTGGTDWTLNTSLDGLAFITQGTQTSGTQAVTTVDTAPSLDIAVGSSGQWIDELVMWCGDKTIFDIFTTQELLNLNDLAATFGEPMNQFEENFGAPICWQATARMPDGSVWRDSGSGSCPPVVRVPRGAEDIVVTDDGMSVSPRVVEG